MHSAGDRQHQVLQTVDPANSEAHQAHSFGEARRFHELGFLPGRPHDPLQRHDVWYVAEQKAGRLRLDQLFVERLWEET